jgi:putative phosphoesterase
VTRSPTVTHSTSETVGVLSDTHLAACTPELLAVCEAHFGTCDRILHAGDSVSHKVLQTLGERWRVDAVRGNMDAEPDLLRLPETLVVSVGGLAVGLYHGHGAPGGIEARVVAAFGDTVPPVIVFGHSHSAADTVFQSVRLLNPGSPTDRRWAPYRSIGRLTVSGDLVEFEIISLE